MSAKIQLVEKITDLLELLADSDSGIGVRELARLSGIPRNTVSRLLASLQEEGWAFHDPLTDKYRIGLRLLSFANRWRLNLEIVHQSMPVLEKLAADTRETAILSVVEDSVAGRCVNKVDSKNRIKLVSEVGSSIPLHAGASGKVLLAFLPSAVQEEVLTKPLKRFTPRTITEPGSLREELRRIRERGYAISVEEVDPGAAAIGAPILDAKGRLIAGLSIAGPRFDFEGGEFERLTPLVLNAAGEISKLLG